MSPRIRQTLAPAFVIHNLTALGAVAPRAVAADPQPTSMSGTAGPNRTSWSGGDGEARSALAGDRIAPTHEAATRELYATPAFALRR